MLVLHCSFCEREIQESNKTHCYDQQPLDICTPYNCTSYDPEYKVLALALALNASVAATLSEEDRNESFSPCITITLPDFLTAGTTDCYDQQPVDICTQFNENDTDKLREFDTCSNNDIEYKAEILSMALNASVAATLPEAERNESLTPCITITLPDFLTAGMTDCYEQQPLDICTPFNENDTDKVRQLVNCSNYDIEYKTQALTAALNASVAATLPEEQRNESLIVSESIVRMCSYGFTLPRSRFNYTCEKYLAMITVTCDTPVELSVPDVGGLGRWQTFVDLINLSSCVFYGITSVLPYQDY
ncbi:hypothetical protein MTO96_026566 [Rhipicephalus appendiculatus]